MYAKEYSKKLNALAKYTLEVTSTNMGRWRSFLGTKIEHSKDVIMGYHAPKSYSKALSRTLRSKTMRERMTKKRGVLN